MRRWRDIRIGVQGHILAGEHAGWMVEVVDDSSGSTGGVYIFVFDPSGREGFDGWVEGLADVPQYFAEAGWSIRWTERPARAGTV